jgi:hypothetical protein
MRDDFEDDVEVEVDEPPQRRRRGRGRGPTFMSLAGRPLPAALAIQIGERPGWYARVVGADGATTFQGKTAFASIHEALAAGEAVLAVVKEPPSLKKGPRP